MDGKRLAGRIGAIAFAGLLGGCGDSVPTTVEAPSPVSLKSLTDYPQANRLLLGEFQAQVRPLINIPVVAPVDGDILFHVEQTRQMLSKDTRWAEVAPEQIAGEELQIKLNTRTEQLRLREEIQQAERELNRVEFMLSDPALKEMTYGDRMPLSTNLINQLSGEIALLKEQLENAGEVERLAFEQQVLRSRLVMPFDGELILSLPVSGRRKTIRVASGMPIGNMRDISQIHLHLIMRDPQMVAIPPEQLVIEFNRDSGELLQARFYDTQIIEMSGQDVLIYRFAFAPERAQELIPLIGANLTCDLWVNSDRFFRVVPKLEAALLLKGKDAFSGWNEAVAELWPGARLLYTGRTHLGIGQEVSQ